MAAPGTDFGRIERNMRKMMEQNAPTEDIDGYLATEGLTAEQFRSRPASQPQKGTTSSGYAAQEAGRRQREGGLDAIGTTEATIGEAATLSAYPQMTAAGRAGGQFLADLMGGRDTNYQGDYARERDVVRSQIDQRRGELGWGALPLDLLGAAATVPAQVPAIAANVATRAPSMARNIAVSSGYGAGFGGVSGFNRETGSWEDKARSAGEHGVGGALLGAALPPAFAAAKYPMDLVTRGWSSLRQREANRAGQVADDFAAADVQPHTPSMLSGLPARAADTLQGTVFGGPIRRSAGESVASLETQLQDALVPAGAARPASEAGEGASRMLRRSFEPATPAQRDEFSGMTPYQLQDVGGVAPSPDYVPPRTRVRGEAVQPVDIEPDLAAARAVVQRPQPREVPPSAPEYSPVDIDRQPFSQGFLAGENNLLTRIRAAEQRQYAIAREHDALLDDLNRTGRLPAYAPDIARRLQQLRQTHSDAVADVPRLERELDKLRSRAFDERSRAMPELQGEADRTARVSAANRTQQMRREAELEAETMYERRQREAEDIARPQAEERARRQTEAMQADADRLAQERADLAQESEITRRRGRAEEPVELPANRDLSYPAQFAAGEEALSRAAPIAQPRMMGQRGAPTNLSRTIDAIALRARGSKQLPGYKTGQFVDEQGQLYAGFPEYLQSKIGRRGREIIEAFSESRAAGTFNPKAENIAGMVEELRALSRDRRVDQRTLNEVINAIDEDIAATAGQTPGGRQWERQRGEFATQRRQFEQEVQEPLRAATNETNPAAALSLLQASTRKGGDINTLRAFLRVATEKGDNHQAVGWLLQGLGDGGPKAFLANWRALTPEAKQLIFGNNPALGARLERLATAGGHLESAMNRPTKQAGPRDLFRISTWAPLIGWHMGVTGAIEGSVGAWATSKILASPRFGNWLKTAPMSGGLQGPEMSGHLARLRAITAAQVGLDEATWEKVKGSLVSSAQAGPMPGSEIGPGQERSGTNETETMWEGGAKRFNEGAYAGRGFQGGTHAGQRYEPDSEGRMRYYRPYGYHESYRGYDTRGRLGIGRLEEKLVPQGGGEMDEEFYRMMQEPFPAEDYETDLHQLSLRDTSPAAQEPSRPRKSANPRDVAIEQALGRNTGERLMMPIRGVASTVARMVGEVPQSFNRLLDYRTGERDPEGQGPVDAMNLASLAGTGGLVTGLGGRTANTLGTFIGRVGAENLAQAGRPTALQAIRRAEALERTGVEVAEIERVVRRVIEKEAPELGAMTRGPDGKWRIEINDRNARFMEPSEGMSDLGRTMDHSEYFAAYPGARDVTVSRAPKFRGALHDPGIPETGLESHIMLGSTRNPRSTMLHEMQHEAQLREGFARGGSPREFAYEGGYERLAGEVEARRTSARADLTPEQRRSTPVRETEPRIPDEMQIVRRNRREAEDPSTEIVAEMRARSAAGESLRSIGREMGVHPATVKRWLERDPRARHAERDTQILQQLAEGGTTSEVARQFGIHPVRVQQIARQHGAARSQERVWTDDKLRLLAERWEAGVPVRDIARELGMPSARVDKAIFNYRNRLGLDWRQRGKEIDALDTQTVPFEEWMTGINRGQNLYE